MRASCSISDAPSVTVAPITGSVWVNLDNITLSFPDAMAAQRFAMAILAKLPVAGLDPEVAEHCAAAREAFAASGSMDATLDKLRDLIGGDLEAGPAGERS